MTEERNRAAWEHTSALLVLTAEIHRDSKKRSRPFKPADFNPYPAARRQRDETMGEISVSELKGMFEF